VFQPLYKTPKTSFLAPYQLRIQQHCTTNQDKNPVQDIEIQQIQLHQLPKEVTPSIKDIHPTTKKGLCNQAEVP